MVWKKLARSFRYAFQGLWYLIQNEKSFRIHLVALVVVIGWAIYFNYSLIESAILLVLCGLVLLTEAINSGIEILLDIIYPEHNGKSKIIKDLMAGAVLISALLAVVVGLIVSWHHFK